MRQRLMALCLGCLLPITAMAQTIDSASAQKLQTDLQSWFAGLLGPNMGAPAQGLRVTPDENHFNVTMPFAAAAGDSVIRAEVRPIPGNRWSIDALRLPDKATMILRMPEPGGSPGTTIPTRLALEVGSQNSHALFDPAFASSSELDIDIGKLGLTTDNEKEHQEQYIDRYVLQTTLQPRDGRLDLVQQGSITGWRSASRVGGHVAVGFGADHLLAGGRIEGIDEARAGALLTAVSGLIATMPPAAAAQHGGEAMAAPTRAAIRALIEALRGVVTRIEGDETIDGLHVAVAGHGEATARHIRLGMRGAAPDGVLHASLNVTVDGLGVPDLPPQARGLVPRHVVLQPSVSGLPLAPLTALALEATNPDVSQAELQAKAATLLAGGNVTVGIDTLALDLGPASVEGSGQVLVAAPDDYQAHARITATGMDALMAQARSNPDLQQALPMLAIARGFARQEGDHLVWDITAGRTGLLVNGIPIGHAPGEHPLPGDHQQQGGMNPPDERPQPQRR